MIFFPLYFNLLMIFFNSFSKEDLPVNRLSNQKDLKKFSIISKSITYENEVHKKTYFLKNMYLKDPFKPNKNSFAFRKFRAFSNNESNNIKEIHSFFNSFLKESF